MWGYSHYNASYAHAKNTPYISAGKINCKFHTYKLTIRKRSVAINLIIFLWVHGKKFGPWIRSIWIVSYIKPKVCVFKWVTLNTSLCCYCFIESNCKKWGKNQIQNNRIAYTFSMLLYNLHNNVIEHKVHPLLWNSNVVVFYMCWFIQNFARKILSSRSRWSIGVK